MLLTASEIISHTWKTFTAHLRDIVKFMVLFGLFFAGLQGSAQIAILISRLTGNVALIILVFAVLTLAVALVIFWLSLALIKALGEALQNQKVENIISALRTTTPSFFAALLASIVMGLLMFIGGLLLIIPGVIFAVWYLFTTYIIIFEKKGAIAAMQSSKALVVGRWWGILWRAVVPQIAFTLVLVVLRSVIMLPFSLLSDVTIYNTVGVVLSVCITAIATPLSTLAMLTLYFNARENPVAQESNLLQN